VFATDPRTLRRTRIFHPRKQRWRNHFEWVDGGRQVEGLTACGRATVAALQLNHPDVLLAREWWIMAHWHPPANEQS
jgi:hypothetical protein